MCAAYENILDEFGIGHCWIKVIVTINNTFKFNNFTFISPANGSKVQMVLIAISKL